MASTNSAYPTFLRQSFYLQFPSNFSFTYEHNSEHEHHPRTPAVRTKAGRRNTTAAKNIGSIPARLIIITSLIVINNYITAARAKTVARRRKR